MKKAIAVCVILMGYFAQGQSLAENSINDATKTAVKRTSWETLTSAFSITGIYIRISKLDSNLFLDFKYAGNGSLLNVDTGSEFILTLDNDKTVTLRTTEASAGCTGCGAVGPGFGKSPGIQVRYPIGADAVSILISHKIKLIHFYTVDGIIEEAIQQNNAGILQKLLQIVK
jgi:hypothetical protein